MQAIKNPVQGINEYSNPDTSQFVGIRKDKNMSK